MTVQLADATGPDSGRAESISILDLLDDAAAGHGTVHFPGEEPEPTPIGELWARIASARRGGSRRTSGPVRPVAAVLTNTRACVAALIRRLAGRVHGRLAPVAGTGDVAASVYAEQLTRFCTAAGAQTLMLDPAHAALLERRVAPGAHVRRGAGGRPVARRSTGVPRSCSSPRAASARRRAST